MKKEEVIKKVMKHLGTKGGSPNQELSKELGVPFIQLQGVTKFLAAEKMISYDKGTKMYSALEPKEEKSKQGASGVDEVLNKEKEEAKEVFTNKSKRDFSKFKFQGQEYNKSRLVMAILAKYCEDKEPTLAELKEAFPDTEIKPYGYGLFRPANEAKKVNEEGRQRFFCKENEFIKTKSGKIACTNQITSELLGRFLLVAKKHKYVVK